MKDIKKYNKELFVVEVVVGVMAIVMFLVMMVVAALLVKTHPTMSAVLIISSMVCFIVVCLALSKMEQVVGYYVCGRCHHRYVPTYRTVLWSLHLGRTRYMTCPKCHRKSWQRKVLV